MKRLLAPFMVLLIVLSAVAVAQNTNSSTTPAAKPDSNTSSVKRGPIFRATKDQIKQAQTILKERGLYGGEVLGKLNDDTRAALRKYQEAEGLKATGTLNRLTLDKMNIALTDKQKAM